MLPANPEDLEAICPKAIENDPEERYPSMVAMADGLGRWLAGSPVDSEPPGWIVQIWFRRP